MDTDICGRIFSVFFSKYSLSDRFIEKRIKGAAQSKIHMCQHEPQASQYMS
jgi:hypothetical protein